MAAPVLSPGTTSCSRNLSDVVKILIRSYSTSAVVPIRSSFDLQKVVKRHRDELKGYGDLTNALNLFDQMTVTKPQPSIAKYASLLRYVSKMKHHSSVIYMFKKMSELGISHNTHTMSTCIISFCRLKDVDLGLSVFGSMIKCGLKPNVVTCTNLIKGMQLEDRFGEATLFGTAYLAIFGRKPGDLVMYNTIVEGLCTSREVFGAVMFICLLIQRKCKPDTITCNTIINGLFNKNTGVIVDDNDLDGNLLSKSIALGLFIHLLTTQLRPAISTYNKLIKELFAINRCDDAKKIFNAMKANRGPRPDIFTCEIFLNGLLDNNLIEDALSFPPMTEDLDLQNNIFLYNVLINGLCKKKNVDLATEVFNGLSLKGLEPDVKTYTIMLRGLLEMGLSSEAKELSVKMENKGCFPWEFTFNVIVHGLLKLNEMEEAVKLVRKMVRRGFTPSASNVSMVVNLVSDYKQSAALMKSFQNLVPIQLMD